MRTKSILLARDTILILGSVNRKAGLKVSTWDFDLFSPSPDTENTSLQQTSSLDLVHTLDRFSTNLMENLEWFVTARDTDGVEMIWTCCIICLAHLAALSHRLSQTDPVSSVSMSRLCSLALSKLGNLSLEVRIGAYGYSDFDLLTGVRVLQWFAAPDEVKRLPNYSTWSDFFENGVDYHRRSHQVAPRHGKRIVATLENCYQNGTRGFSSKFRRVRPQLFCFVRTFGGGC